MCIRKLGVVVIYNADPGHDVAAGKFGTTHSKPGELPAFLRAQSVEQVAMESTAKYWRPVWIALEGEFELQLAQARSTRAPRRRKWDTVGPLGIKNGGMGAPESLSPLSPFLKAL
jgi:hypothetical protein